MGIHYDYKSTRGDKAMKKEAKTKSKNRSKEGQSVLTAILRVRRKNNA